MRKVEILEDADAVASRAADLILAASAEAIAERGRFMIALSGGSTPEKTFRLLASPTYAHRLEWQRVFLFWSDERDVAPQDSRSNFGMANRSLISAVPLSLDHVFPIAQSPGGPEESAKRYARDLTRIFGSDTLPRFDMILLGMGDDGHCASLFPGHASLDVREKWVVATPPGTLPPPVDRMTFTFPLINAARQVLFLVAGENKAPAVYEIFDQRAPISSRPAAGVDPDDGIVTWLLDTSAASLTSLTRIIHDQK